LIPDSPIRFEVQQVQPAWVPLHSRPN
jgi:hypothetical protein